MKKKIAALLCVILPLALCAGCAQTKTEDALSRIKSKGVLTVSLSPDFAPMEFVDTSKEGQEQYVGFDVTLAKYIAEKLGVSLQIEAMEFSACQAAVQTKSVDISISGYSKTPEREQYFTLSDFYYAGDNESNQCLMVLKENLDKYTTAESVAGAKVGAQIASLQMNLLKEQLPDAQAVEISDLNTAVLELAAGKIDALCVAKGNGEAFMANYDVLALSPWEFTVEDEGNVILMPKEEESLCAEINKILAQAYKDGEYNPWYEAAKELSGMDTAAEVSVGG